MTGRRQFLKLSSGVGLGGLTALAGCTGSTGGGSGTATESGSGGSGGGESTATETATATESSGGTAFNDGELNFLMSPSEPQDLMEKQYEPVQEYLTEEVHDPTVLRYARNYSAVVQAMGSGTADVAETGPFAAALGVRADKADIALQRYAYGSWEYSSVIVTKEGSDVESLADLEGRSVALADRLSASGSLFPLSMLKEAGLDTGGYPEEAGSADFEAQYAGGHSSAFAALEADQVPAAGVGKFITLNDDRELKDGYRYVETTDGIPRAPMIVSPTLSDEERTAIVDAMKEAPESVYLGADGEADTDDDLWFSDVRPATVDTYQPVIDVANELGIKTELLDG
jgi:phosphonate transport system substrate-binding protein